MKSIQGETYPQLTVERALPKALASATFLFCSFEEVHSLQYPFSGREHALMLQK